ncbi:hypothetical protein BKA93DRAFT_747390 [Sparassis latifolia]
MHLTLRTSVSIINCCLALFTLMDHRTPHSLGYHSQAQQNTNAEFYVSDAHMEVHHMESPASHMRLEAAMVANACSHVEYQSNPCAHLAANHMPYIQSFHQSVLAMDATNVAAAQALTANTAHTSQPLVPDKIRSGYHDKDVNPRVAANMARIMDDPFAFAAVDSGYARALAGGAFDSRSSEWYFAVVHRAWQKGNGLGTPELYV